MSGRRGSHTHRGGRPSRLRRRLRLRGGIAPGLDLPGLDTPPPEPDYGPPPPEPEAPPTVEPPVIDPTVVPPAAEPPAVKSSSAKLVLGAVAIVAMLYWFFRRKP